MAKLSEGKQSRIKNGVIGSILGSFRAKMSRETRAGGFWKDEIWWKCVPKWYQVRETNKSRSQFWLRTMLVFFFCSHLVNI